MAFVKLPFPSALALTQPEFMVQWSYKSKIKQTKIEKVSQCFKGVCTFLGEVCSELVSAVGGHGLQVRGACFLPVVPLPTPTSPPFLKQLHFGGDEAPPAVRSHFFDVSCPLRLYLCLPPHPASSPLSLLIS